MTKSVTAATFFNPALVTTNIKLAKTIDIRAKI
jgi:hypothetical protein